MKIAQSGHIEPSRLTSVRLEHAENAIRFAKTQFFNRTRKPTFRLLKTLVKMGELKKFLKPPSDGIRFINSFTIWFSLSFSLSHFLFLSQSLSLFLFLPLFLFIWLSHNWSLCVVFFCYSLTQYISLSISVWLYLSFFHYLSLSLSESLCRFVSFFFFLIILCAFLLIRLLLGSSLILDLLYLDE